MHSAEPIRGTHRILIVDDAPAVRESLGWLLLDQPGFSVVGGAADGSEAMQQVLELNPDLVILDIELPDIDGFIVTRQLKALPSPPLVVLLMFCAGLRAELLRYENSAQAMGSLYTIAAYGEDRAQLSAGVGAALQEVRRIDDLLSNYKVESELSEVNRDAARKPVKVSGELFDLLTGSLY